MLFITCPFDNNPLSSIYIDGWYEFKCNKCELSIYCTAESKHPSYDSGLTSIKFNAGKYKITLLRYWKDNIFDEYFFQIPSNQSDNGRIVFSGYGDEFISYNLDFSNIANLEIQIDVLVSFEL